MCRAAVTPSERLGESLEDLRWCVVKVVGDLDGAPELAESRPLRVSVDGFETFGEQFVEHLAECSARLECDPPRSFVDLVIYGHCGAHTRIIASLPHRLHRVHPLLKGPRFICWRIGTTVGFVMKRRCQLAPSTTSV